MMDEGGDAPVRGATPGGKPPGGKIDEGGDAPVRGATPGGKIDEGGDAPVRGATPAIVTNYTDKENLSSCAYLANMKSFTCICWHNLV